jgi:hypothetical protein
MKRTGGNTCTEINGIAFAVSTTSINWAAGTVLERFCDIVDAPCIHCGRIALVRRSWRPML